VSSTPPIRLICFDLDGTLLDRTVFVWSTLHEHFPSDPLRRKQAWDDYFAHRISYAEWFYTDLELLRAGGATRERMKDVFAELHPAPGAHETLRELRERGYRLALISGSLDLALEQFFPPRMFDHVLINRVQFDESGRISGGEPTPYDLEGKVAGLRELARRESLDVAQCAFVGDNFNDLPVMRAAGFSIGIHIKHPDVHQAVNVAIADDDLRAILPYFPKA
jgi:HAD superfamily phosphoserine phosphatase-like hydrolase